MGFWERMDGVINQGINTSRDVLGKAGAKARELGEKGLLKWEISQLEKEAQQVLSRLGSVAYNRLVTQSQPVMARTDSGVERILLDIQDIERRIAEKEEALKKIG